VSPAQETLLRGIYGLPLPSSGHLDLWHQCTGRTTYAGQPFGEVTVIAGARSGKDSRILCPAMAYESVFGGHEAHLAKGEQAMIPLVAQDQRGTRVAYGYLRDYLTGSPLLSQMLEEPPLMSELHLTNRITVLSFPCTLRSMRAFSIPAAALDELAFYRLEGQADSDAEIQTSTRRGMLAFPAPRLVKASTPYMKGGVVFEDFRRAWGQDDPDLLVWRAPTALMNPSVTVARLERERRLDPVRFPREYEAEFTDDVASFVSRDTVERCVIPGRHGLPPVAGVAYVAFVDPSGGARDSMTLCIAHSETRSARRIVVVDVLRERPAPFSPEGVVAEFATLCRAYRCAVVTGDRYGGLWPEEQFRKHGVRYEVSDRVKSDLFCDLLPELMAEAVELPDLPVLVTQLAALERRASRGGRESVEKPIGRHDDAANAVAGAVWGIARHSRCSGGGARPIINGRIRTDMSDEEAAAYFDKLDAAQWYFNWR
jgi:hypothetical protein